MTRHKTERSITPATLRRIAKANGLDREASDWLATWFLEWYRRPAVTLRGSESWTLRALKAFEELAEIVAAISNTLRKFRVHSAGQAGPSKDKKR